MNNINKQCLEDILQHLRKLICLMEYEDVKTIQKFVDMATSVSAQLLAIDEQNNKNIKNEDNNEGVNIYE